MTYTYNYLQFQKLTQKFLIITLSNQCISNDVFTIITSFFLLRLYVIINSVTQVCKTVACTRYSINAITNTQQVIIANSIVP